MKRVFLVSTPGRKDIAQALTNALPLIKKHLEVVGVNCDGECDFSTIDADFIMVFGGDGTILGTVHRLGTKPLPIIGINLGTLGFLTEATLEELPQALKNIQSDSFITTTRSMLHWEIKHASGKREAGRALNELAIRRRNDSHIFSTDLIIDSSAVTRFKGDGLLVATPTGSTAYNLSAQGPILESSLDAFIINPLYPHSLSHRPLVVSSTRTIEIVPLINTTSVEVSVDGRDAIVINKGTTIHITMAPTRLKFIELSLHSQYEKLRAKLGWGL